MCILLLDVATVDCLQYIRHIHCLIVGKTRRGVGVGDQWVKPGDWELGDHIIKLCFDYKLD